MVSRFKKIHFGFLKITVGFLLVFGFISFLTLDTSGTPIEIIQNQITGRGPASVSPTVQSTEVLQIDCNQFDREVSVSAHQIRIEGKLCNTKDSDLALENIDQDNSPTIFKRKNYFTTDYINLKEGETVFSLKFRDKNNKEVVKNLRVIR